MKLYYSPGACSLADHIALLEAGLEPSLVKVDLKAKTIEGGSSYLEVNPKGYVPALGFDDGAVLTENIAILTWIAGRGGALAGPSGEADDLGTARLLEALAYISTEVHKSFKPFFSPGSTDADKKAAGESIGKRLAFLDERMGGGFVLGGSYSVADAYLYVMLRWAKANKLALPGKLGDYFERMSARPAVQQALKDEGLEAAKAA